MSDQHSFPFLWPDSAVPGSWEIYLGGYDRPVSHGGKTKKNTDLRVVRHACASTLEDCRYVPAVAEAFIYVVV
jgi:hypothetical protein